MIRAGQRLIVVGPAGCGKTRWEMKLLEGNPSVVVFDVKQDPDEWISYGRAHDFAVVNEPLLVGQLARVVLLVDDLWLQDRDGWTKPASPGYRWTEALWAAWKRGDTTVVFAEGLQLLPSVGAAPFARKIITQGRSRRLTTVSDFQVANWTDTLIVRQADHAVVFRCDAEDVRLLRRRGAPVDPLLTLEPHAWAHHAQGGREWTVYDPLPQDQIWGGGPPGRPPRRRNGVDEATPSPVAEGATTAA